MDLKKILRGPIFWISLAVLLVLIGSSFLSGIGAPTQVDTSEAIADIQGNKVDTATIVDRDQVLDLTLKDGTKARAQYVQGQGVNLQEQLQAKADAEKRDLKVDEQTELDADMAEGSAEVLGQAGPDFAVGEGKLLDGEPHALRRQPGHGRRRQSAP